LRDSLTAARHLAVVGLPLMVDQRVAPQETVRRELKTPPILFAAEHKKAIPRRRTTLPDGGWHFL